MAADITARVGHQSEDQARETGAAFLARTKSTLHCETGLCYIGHNGLFPCRCDELFARLR